MMFINRNIILYCLQQIVRYCDLICAHLYKESSRLVEIWSSVITLMLPNFSINRAAAFWVKMKENS